MDEYNLDKQFIAQNLEAALKAAYFALGFHATEDVIEYVYNMYADQIPDHMNGTGQVIEACYKEIE